MLIQPGPQPHYEIQSSSPGDSDGELQLSRPGPFTGQIPTGGPFFTGSDTWSLVDP
jgi:hypothetical protein